MANVVTESKSNSVTIGCKLPNGMTLELSDADHEKIEIRVNGASHPDARFGHGVTENVDRAFWEKWVEDNKRLKIVKNGFIFAHGSRHDVEDHAKDRKDVKTKLERLIPVTAEGANPMGITTHKA
jgi:hypothetical protein